LNEGFIEIFSSQKRPVEQFKLWQIANHKIAPSPLGSATVSPLVVVTDIAQQGLNLEDSPIQFDAKNGKKIKLFLPEGLVTAATGVATPIIKGVDKAYGQAPMANITDDKCYSIRLWFDIIEYSLTADR
jgi:hypothetical protein